MPCIVIQWICDYGKARFAVIDIKSVVELVSGTPQFRIVEDLSGNAPAYCFYTQSDLEEDLGGLNCQSNDRKQVRTFDAVNTLAEGDVVFSLLSGKAAIVQAQHGGYIFTQNYLAFKPTRELDARYLVYLVNEDRSIRHQLRISQQGSSVMKYTIAQLGSLMLPELPPPERQRLIGQLYLNQMQLAALKKRTAELETALVLGEIREAVQR